ncbi:MAG: glycosyltransferase family 2 protein [Alphaproteobacteria bacterium]|nr:glycosyltransferase family 2 protein [Alphaproteobacteria bacterium]
MDLSIIIPVRNEAANIGPLVQEIRAALDGRLDYEVIVVDDGSTDGTADVLRGIKREFVRLRVLRHVQRSGQSAAIRSGVKAARSAWIATLDGDGQNDPADIPRLWELARPTPAASLMIAGMRQKRRDTTVKRLASRIANRIRARLLDDGTPDTGCGLKLFPRALYLDLPFFDHNHRFLPALALRQGGKVQSIAVNHRPRGGGVSNYKVLDRLWVGIVDLIGVLWLKQRAVNPEVREE